MSGVLGFSEIEELIGGRVGIFNVTCPVCSPSHHRRRTTLKIWRRTPEQYASFHCARCNARGYAFGNGVPRMDRQAFHASRELADRLDKTEIQKSRDKARALWCRSKPIEGSVAKRYLRTVRGIRCELPTTLAYLEPGDGYPPAMIAAFGMAREVLPGVLAIDPGDVMGVHLTLLRNDGLAKAGTNADKRTIGKSHDMPIMLMPPTDMMSLVVAEGIEDALSAGSTLRMGAMAAGSAGRLPSIAKHIPDWMETVTVLVDDDRIGERYSHELAIELQRRGIEVSLVKLRPHERQR
jgi:hypothetical protein